MVVRKTFCLQVIKLHKFSKFPRGSFKTCGDLARVAVFSVVVSVDDKTEPGADSDAESLDDSASSLVGKQ